MNDLTNFSSEMTMTTVEIAELCNKRHDNVMRVANQLAGKGIITSPQIEELFTVNNGAKLPRSIFRLNKTESLNLVANLSPEFTARVIDRWQELENAAPALPNFSDEIEAAQAWIEAKKGERKAQLALEEAAPKIESYEHFIEGRSENYNLTRAMKTVCTKPNLAIRALRKRGILYGSPATPAAYYADRKYFTMLPVEDRNEPGKMRPQTFVTPKGLEWLRRKLPEIMGNA
jgi:phage regulator Rha-like protein